MKNDPLAYPNTLDYFGLSRYIASDGESIVRLPSPYKNSHESQVNYALSMFEAGEFGYKEYLSNRLRERISCLIFNSTIPGCFAGLSTMTHDILCKIDAITVVHGMPIALDFTEDQDQVLSKLARTDPDGQIPIIGTERISPRIPLVVFTIAENLVDTVLNKTEDLLTADPFLTKSQVQRKVKHHIKDFFLHDHARTHITGMHTNAQGLAVTELMGLYQKRMEKYAKNPPPSR